MRGRVNDTGAWRTPAIGPPLFSFPWLWPHVSRRHSFARSTEPLRPVHTARPDDAALFSLGLGAHSHIRAFATGPPPPFGATGDAGSTRGRPDNPCMAERAAEGK